MMPSYTIGVDPGASGAIAILDGPELVVVHDMPVADGTVSGQMLACLESWGESIYGTAVIERVHSMPRQGVASTFKFGRATGMVEMLFIANRRPVVYVAPHKWKADLKLSKGKGAARQRAMELWPEATGLFLRSKDDGRAEAALIAHWYETRHLRVP